MVDRPVIKSKLATAESRLRELKAHRMLSRHQFERNKTIQAAILHHLQVAIQACCDIASHLVADEGWGIPGSAGELFDVLAQHRVITLLLGKKLRDLVGLRNLIVHGYDKLDAGRVHAGLAERRRTIANFLKAVVAYARL